MKQLLTLTAIVLLSGCVTMTWDGDFPDGEYSFIFKDREGRPIEGIAVEIRSSSGKLSFDYPIKEYTSENSLVTSEKGEVTFSHKAGGIEFGGSCHTIGVAEWGECSGPEYQVVFTLDGRQIYATKYSILSGLGEKVSVERVVH